MFSCFYPCLSVILFTEGASPPGHARPPPRPPSPLPRGYYEIRSKVDLDLVFSRIILAAPHSVHPIHRNILSSSGSRHLVGDIIFFRKKISIGIQDYQRGRQPIIWPIFLAENCMKMKTI